MKPANLLVAVPALLLACSISVSADAASSPTGKSQAGTAALVYTASGVVPAKAAPTEAPAEAVPAKAPAIAAPVKAPAKAIPAKASPKKAPAVKAANTAKDEIRQVQAWINAEAKKKIPDDRLKDFSYRWIQLDDDPELELVAKINDSVRLGQFYVLDRRPNGTYALLTEQRWNVPHLDLERWDYNRFDNPNWSTVPPEATGEVGGKRLFETLDKSGGTGTSVFYAHLWYIENGKFVEAWEGTMLETASEPGGPLFQTIGQYQIVQTGPVPLLYYWKTMRELDPESRKPLSSSSVQTEVHIFPFENGSFKPAPAVK
ncbi:hypothetical protein [Brevibacillus borstelensis]|uniref:hypothetical protein n=1 Tax=Brevibacillus borstelensis TaxID=45462 RepID=UPI0030C4ED9E